MHYRLTSHSCPHPSASSQFEWLWQETSNADASLQRSRLIAPTYVAHAPHTLERKLALAKDLMEFVPFRSSTLSLISCAEEELKADMELTTQADWIVLYRTATVEAAQSRAPLLRPSSSAVSIGDSSARTVLNGHIATPFESALASSGLVTVTEAAPPLTSSLS